MRESELNKGRGKIVVCPDSFKGSLTATEAVEAITLGLGDAGFGGEIVRCPLADGGEGFLEVLENTFNGALGGGPTSVGTTGLQWITVDTCDAIGAQISALYAIDEKQKRAFIESARIIGLPLIAPEARNPLVATTKGLGIVLDDALRRGCHDLYISLGGSATCDGGMGMLEALGVKFLDAEGHALQGNGQNLSRIMSIDATATARQKLKAGFHAVCDVSNPLLGPSGAIAVFAPQKGAREADLPVLEAGMMNLMEKCVSSGMAPLESASEPGAGAAGGLGYALTAFLGARTVSGIDFLLERLRFPELINDAGIIITGEGKLDAQSLMGKVVGGVLKEGIKARVPVVAFAGKVEHMEALLEAGLIDAVAISSPDVPLNVSMEPRIAMANLRDSVARYFST